MQNYMINHNKLICNIFLDDNDRVTKLGNKLSKKTSQNRYPNIYAYIQQVKNRDYIIILY